MNESMKQTVSERLGEVGHNLTIIEGVVTILEDKLFGGGRDGDDSGMAKSLGGIEGAVETAVSMSCDIAARLNALLGRL